MSAKSFDALDLLTMGKMDVRAWWRRMDRDRHGQLMKHGFIRTIPNKTGSVWYVEITSKGRARLRQGLQI